MRSTQPTTFRVRALASLAALFILASGLVRPAGAQAPASPDANQHPKAIQIPGTETWLTFGGYVKLDLIHDLDPIGNAFDFKVNSIPIEGTSAAEVGGRTTLHARESRLSLDVQSGTGKAKARGFVEGDFHGDGNVFRLRHAYGTWNNLLAGQTWSTFMDVSARPQTIDLEGPDGEVFLRQALLRWTQPVSDSWKWTIGVENPSPELTIASGLTGSARGTIPDLATNLRYEAGKTHVQLGGLFRQVRYEGGAGGDDSSESGWGVSGSFKARVARPLDVMGQVYTGEGIGHYVSALEGQSADAYVDGSGLTTLPASGLVAGLVLHLSKVVRSGLSYSMVSVDNDVRQSATAIRKAEDIRADIIWTAAPPVDLGLEVLWGGLEQHDGGTGEAVRLQFATIVHLN